MSPFPSPTLLFSSPLSPLYLCELLHSSISPFSPFSFPLSYLSSFFFPLFLFLFFSTLFCITQHILPLFPLIRFSLFSPLLLSLSSSFFLHPSLSSSLTFLPSSCLFLLSPLLSLLSLPPFPSFFLTLPSVSLSFPLLFPPFPPFSPPPFFDLPFSLSFYVRFLHPILLCSPLLADLLHHLHSLRPIPPPTSSSLASFRSPALLLLLSPPSPLHLPPTLPVPHTPSQLPLYSSPHSPPPPLHPSSTLLFATTSRKDFLPHCSPHPTFLSSPLPSSHPFLPNKNPFPISSLPSLLPSALQPSSISHSPTPSKSHSPFPRFSTVLPPSPFHLPFTHLLSTSCRPHNPEERLPSPLLTPFHSSNPPIPSHYLPNTVCSSNQGMTFLPHSDPPTPLPFSFPSLPLLPVLPSHLPNFLPFSLSTPPSLLPHFLPATLPFHSMPPPLCSYYRQERFPTLLPHSPSHLPPTPLPRSLPSPPFLQLPPHPFSHVASSPNYKPPPVLPTLPSTSLPPFLHSHTSIFDYTSYSSCYSTPPSPSFTSLATVSCSTTKERFFHFPSHPLLPHSLSSSHSLLPFSTFPPTSHPYHSSPFHGAPPSLPTLAVSRRRKDRVLCLSLVTS
ncbi:hypothetical protein C7M84_017013 [Penaeus vannamei]|uniref:Uncharacterized protein n=1 Tax=Penaeus vannamei TaxID=6689 RepID=A0A3R7MLT4_PENVA|nr:hypothetical protein C7M84_017013 [Penaeus vannamei]